MSGNEWTKKLKWKIIQSFSESSSTIEFNDQLVASHVPCIAHRIRVHHTSLHPPRLLAICSKCHACMGIASATRLRTLHARTASTFIYTRSWTNAQKPTNHTHTHSVTGCGCFFLFSFRSICTSTGFTDQHTCSRLAIKSHLRKHAVGRTTNSRTVNNM